MRGAVFLTSIALLATGCAMSNGKTDSPSRTTKSESKKCRAGTASPISERTLERALDTQGIQAYRDEDCAPDALVRLSNTAIPYEQQDAVVSSEGDIFCDVYRTDIFGSRIERFVWRNDPRPTYLRVLNVSCAIYPESKEHTDTLEMAFRQLPGVSAQPTTVPSSDAIHD
jgi:hypothetical protein